MPACGQGIARPRAAGGCGDLRQRLVGVAPCPQPSDLHEAPDGDFWIQKEKEESANRDWLGV
jgi:hypothetical protein